MVKEVDISVYNKVLDEKLYISIDIYPDDSDLNSNNEIYTDSINYTSSEHIDSS